MIKRLVTFVFPLLFGLVMVYLRLNRFDWYWFLIKEDSIFEYLQFLGLFISGMVLMKQYWSANHKKSLVSLTLFGLALGLLAISLEEISYGQRLFNINNPQYFAENNIQNELTLHNLSNIQPFLAGGYMGISLLLGVIFPLIKLILQKILIKNSYLLIHRKLVHLPGWELSGYFIPVGVVYALLVFWQPFGAIMDSGVPLMIWQDQEFGETLLALGIWLHIKNNKCFQ